MSGLPAVIKAGVVCLYSLSPDKLLLSGFFEKHRVGELMVLAPGYPLMSLGLLRDKRSSVRSLLCVCVGMRREEEV